MTPTPEQIAAVHLNLMSCWNPRDLLRMKEQVGSFDKIIKEGPPVWNIFEDLSESDRRIFQLEFEESRRRLDSELRIIEKEDIQLFVWGEPGYPNLLSHISAPPHLLYVKGHEVDFEIPAVAIVGSRRCTYYGEKMSQRFSRVLADAGVVTVSGLARGIDSHVHRATLEAGGKTWAVMGNGLSNVYPPENESLAKAIQRGGAIISEFPLEMKPYPGNFPRRNRIVAGLTRATVVIEGGEKSGSLITARLAVEEGRDVYALPGPVTSPLSKAPHRLIQMGAKLLDQVEEVLLDFPEEERDKLKIKYSSTTEKNSPLAYQEILAKLDETPLPKEALAQQVQMTTPALSTLLFQMEMEGFIRSLPGGYLVKA